MKVEITDLSSCMKQVLVEIPESTVSEQFRRVSMMIAQSVSIPGFRKGRAPLSVIKNRYRKEIHDQVMRDLLPTALHTAIVENNIPMVGDPHIDEIVLKDGAAFVFKARLEVIPDFEVGQYRGLKLVRRVRVVTDEMVKAKLEELRHQHATLVPVEDREARLGDYVSIELHGEYLTDKPEEPMHADNLPLWLSPQEGMEEIVNNTVGLKIGEEKTFETEYGQDYPNPKFAGKRLRYRIRLNSIKVKELPELDDEFAASISEFSSLEELQASIRRALEDGARNEADANLREQVFRALVEGKDFEVPEIMLQAQLGSQLNSFKMHLARSGIDPRTVDWKQLLEQQREEAKREVRSRLILEKIASIEDIKVSEEELEQHIASLAAALGATVEATRSRLTKEGAIDSIKIRIRNKKALDLIIGSAQISEETVASEEVDKKNSDFGFGASSEEEPNLQSDNSP
ncbi:MAG: trigger factor [Acidobacteriota bacterium]|nr:trigger factor [Blastocatellia bacterium]MDW8412256.1 trigger factor [Acidobacteriota bacterium]